MRWARWWAFVRFSIAEPLRSIGKYTLGDVIRNAGGVRAGRLEDTPEAEIRAMIEVDLVAPILLTKGALSELRASNGVVVNISSGIVVLRASARRCAAK